MGSVPLILNQLFEHIDDLFKFGGFIKKEICTSIHILFPILAIGIMGKYYDNRGQFILLDILYQTNSIPTWYWNAQYHRIRFQSLNGLHGLKEILCLTYNFNLF